MQLRILSSYEWMVEKERLKNGQSFGDIALTRLSKKKAEEEGIPVQKH